MIDLFYKSCSNKMNIIKIIKITLIILFAVFVALLPAFRAYASSVFVGALLAGLLGTAVGAVLTEAGCALIIAVIIGMGVSISVSMLYALFNDQSFQTSFLQAWDNFKTNFQYRVVGTSVFLSGAGFKAIYDLVKTHIVDHFQITVAPDVGDGYPLLNAINNSFGIYMNEQSFNYITNLSNEYKYSYNATPQFNSLSLDIDLNNPYTEWNSKIKLMNNSGALYFTYTDANYHLKFYAYTLNRYSTTERACYPMICYPVVYNNELFFPCGWGNSFSTMYNHYYVRGDIQSGNDTWQTRCWFTEDDNPSISSNDIELCHTRSSSNRQCYYEQNGVRHYLGAKLPDGTIISDLRNVGNLLYYLLCTECELVDTTQNQILNSSIGSASSTVNNYYSTNSDRYYNYYNQIAAAETAGTLATGTDSDVKISTSSLVNSLSGTEALTDTVALTDVQSNVQTTTGETIAVSPSITCMTGINLIRVTSGGIRDKFPFAVVYVLRDTFNVFVGERVTPQFTIPFEFSIGNLYSIDEDLHVDLSSLNTIAAIARWGEAGALGIALAILTKRMMF